MGQAPTDSPQSTAGDIEFHARGFELTLASRRKRPNAIKSYLDAVEQLDTFLSANGMPGDVATILREHVESFIVDRGRHPRAGDPWLWLGLKGRLTTA